MLKISARIRWFLEKVTQLLYDSARKTDYLVAALFAALPIAAAWVAGVLRDSEVHGVAFTGMASSKNWWILTLQLPVVLWILRWVVEEHLPGSSGTTPLVRLFDSDSAVLAAKQLTAVVRSPINLLAAFCLIVIIQIGDMAEVAALYLRRFSGTLATRDIREKDYFVMRILDDDLASVWKNLATAALSYTVQFLVGLLAFLVVIVLLRHNLFFVSRVYQRRRDGIRPHLVIDWDHGDKHFGFGEANLVFNRQVVILMIAGILLLWSRFHNISADQSRGLLDAIPDLLFFLKLDFSHVKHLSLLGATLPDFGQTILVLSWLLLLAVISLPALVKFLPFGKKGAFNIDRTDYLKEFKPSQEWPADAKVDDIASRFAGHSFWPTGDSRARWLFGLSFTVLFVMIYPVYWEPDRILQFCLCYAVFIALGFGIAYASLCLLQASLAYVDPSLVKAERK